MDVAWSRNQVELGDALARSPHSLHSGSSRRRRHGSSGRASDSSFVTSMDGGADLISLEWALSNSAGSDAEFNDWNLNFDALSASPTSNGTPDNEHYMSSNGNSAHAPRSFDAGFTSNGGLPIDQSTNISRSAFQANPARNAPPTDQTFLPLVDSHSYAVSGGLPGWPDEHRYNFQYIPPPNNPRYGRTRRTPVSASSLATNGSIHEPWSPESHPRYNRIPSADVNMFGPASDNLEPYASSVHSHNSLDSPLFSFNPTPSPARSPIPAQAEPFKSLSLMSERQLSNCSSLSGVSPTDQTPRPRQTAFPHAEQSRRPFTATDVKPSPRLLTENTSQTISIDNTHSPTSDFVLVDSATDIQSSPSPKPIKRKASEVEEAHEFETVFIRHIFSPDQDYSLNHEAHLARKRVNGNRVGGRATGSHLNAQSAARARELREKGSCWICCLQRDSCSPGETCDRCLKRNQRSQLEQGFTLGCDRTKLVDLKPIFIPDVLIRTHEESTLKSWCAQHIKRWGRTAIEIKMEFIWGLPPLECEVYEFEPKTNELLRQFQYCYNEETGGRDRIEKFSPPLGMVQIERADRNRYEKYLDMIVDKYMDQFAGRCYFDEKDDFMVRLLRLMVHYEPEKAEEANLLRDIYRLIVISYMFGRTATISQDQYHLLYQLHSYSAQTVEYATRCSPRMANRQLKFLFCTIFNTRMESVLKRLQQILRSSKRDAKWTSAFCALLGLAMVFEDTQNTTHCRYESGVGTGHYTKQDAEYRAEAACRAIDVKFGFLTNLFRWKYHRGFNPLLHWREEKVRSELGDSAVEFAKGVSLLVSEKYDSFLFERQHVSVCHQNPEKYCSRLVARFLISFFGPTIE